MLSITKLSRWNFLSSGKVVKILTKVNKSGLQSARQIVIKNQIKVDFMRFFKFAPKIDFEGTKPKFKMIILEQKN